MRERCQQYDWHDDPAIFGLEPKLQQSLPELTKLCWLQGVP